MRQWTPNYRPGIDPPYDNPNHKCCGTCKFNHREKQDTFTCANEDSEYYASYTDYDDMCEDYEPKEDEYR